MRTDDNKFWISRVSPCWGNTGEFDYYVEVAHSFDATSPDALGAKYKKLGEGQGYEDPREAAKAAIAVCKQWQADTPDDTIGLEWQTMAGGYFGVPADEVDETEILELAEKTYQSLPKCAKCGELLGTQTYQLFDWIDDEEFCSENCAESMYWELMEPMEEGENDDG